MIEIKSNKTDRASTSDWLVKEEIIQAYIRDDCTTESIPGSQLRCEFLQWDLLSDEALEKFEGEI